MLFAVVDAFKKLGLPGVKNDDFFDRLSRKYSITLLGISFLIVTTSYFIGKPMLCYTQMVDSKYKTDYIDWVCWISSSYYLPFDQPLPNRNQAKPERIPYYQWVPFILFTMMILFYIPGFIWRKLNRNCGLDIKAITSVMNKIDNSDSEKRTKNINELAAYINRAFNYQREYPHGFMYRTWKRFSCLLCCSVGKQSGNYLAFSYIFVKLLYIINAIGQLFLLNVFMGDRFHLYGFEILRKWFYGLPVEAVERFPRITMCRFILRTLGDNIQNYDVQCLLPNNIYNEKIFLVIWFWLALISLASVYGLIKWLHCFTSQSRQNFIRRFLKANDIDYYAQNENHCDPETFRIFVDQYCRQDGVLLMRILSANMDCVMVGEIICALWKQWRTQRPTPVNIVARDPEPKKVKRVEDHDSSNLSISVPSKIYASNIPDDRYILLSPRSQQL